MIWDLKQKPKFYVKMKETHNKQTKPRKIIKMSDVGGFDRIENISSLLFCFQVVLRDYREGGGIDHSQN